MRYILNDTNYIEAVSFGCSIECKDKTCTEYTGTIPTGYESLAEWSETANINAYKIVDGNLTYDSAEDTRLQTLWESQKANGGSQTNTNIYSEEEKVIGTWIDSKPIYRKVIVFETSQLVSQSCGLNTNILDAETVITQNSFWFDSQANRWRTMPGNYYATNDWDSQGSFNITSGDMVYELGTSAYDRIKTKATHLYLILEYTKTTD